MPRPMAEFVETMKGNAARLTGGQASGYARAATLVERSANAKEAEHILAIDVRAAIRKSVEADRLLDECDTDGDVHRWIEEHGQAADHLSTLRRAHIVFMEHYL